VRLCHVISLDELEKTAISIT